MKRRKVLVCLLCIVILSCFDVCRTYAYSERTTEPTRDNKCYYSDNVFQKSGYGMWTRSGAKRGNCTAYAWGRAYELLGKKPKLGTGNAGSWWNNNKNKGSYSYGKQPKLGAVAVWDKYDGNHGHVAVVEKIMGNKVIISESHYEGVFFDTRKINSDSSDYLKSMRFLGYIYIGDFGNSSISKPSNPAIQSAVANSTSSITITWNGVSNATGYRIDRRKAGNNTSYETVKEVSSNTTTWKDTNLAAGTHYYYRVYAKNDAGYSEKQDGYSAYTLTQAPQIKKVSTISQSELQITWGKVAGATTYTVLRRASGTEEYKEVKTVSETSWNDSGLKAGQGYWYKICAVNNGGKSAASDNEYGMTTCAAPSVKTKSATSVSVQWNAVTGKTSYIYVLYRKKSGDSSFQKLTTTGNTSYTDTGLISNQKYSYKLAVLEKSTNTQVMVSAESAGTTAALPAAPSIKISNQDSNVIGISWNVVNYAQKYKVYRKGSSDTSYALLSTTSSTSYLDQKVTNGVKYEYYVEACNEAGTSAKSNIVSAYAVLPAPSGISCTAKGKTSIEVTWTSVKGADGYYIKRRKDGDSEYKTIMQCTNADDTSFLDTGLLPGTTYYYKMKTWTGNQGSAISDYAKATTVAGQSSSLEAPVVEIEAVSTTSLKVSWNSVSGAKKYEVYRRLAGESYPTNPTYTTTSTTLTDNKLSAGTRYWYRVYAINSAGDKTAKQPGVMCYTIPAQPAVTVQTVDMTSLKVQWNSVNGASYYKLNIRKAGDETYETITTTENISYVAGDLQPGTTYYFRVYAVVSDRNSYDCYMLSEKPAGVGGTTKYNPATCTHSYNNWVIEKNAGCQQTGSKYQICSKCGYKNTQSIAALGHSWNNNWVIEREADCENDGVKYKTCKNCNSKGQVTTIPAKGHSYGEWSTEKVASCKEEGLRTRTCSVCKDKDTEIVALAEHEYELSNVVNATEQVQGYEEYTCKSCGTILKQDLDQDLEQTPEVKLTSSLLEFNLVGEKKAINVKVVSGVDSDLDVEWISEDKSVAIVDENGTITAVGAGETTIVALIEGGLYKESCKVKVKKTEQTTETVTTQEQPSIDNISVSASLGKVTLKNKIKVTKKTIQLEWKQLVNADGYKVYRYSSSKKKWILKKTLQGTSSVKFKDKKLKAGTQYQYKVKAYQLKNGEYVYGNECTVKVCTKPKKLKITQTFGTVKWKKTSGEGYLVQKYDASSKKWKTWKKLRISTNHISVKKNIKIRIAAYQKGDNGRVLGKWSVVTIK